jgi:wobble nucleotide-excising tRNase
MIKRINGLKHIGRFIDLRSGNGEEGDFSELNIVYGKNASGKSTLCDVFRSLTTGDPAYINGRQRLGGQYPPEVFVALANPDTTTARFQNGAWRNDQTCPTIHVYDDRFVAENVLVGHHISVDQRRNLYGLVIGAQAIALKQAVDAAEQELAIAALTERTARSNLTRLLPQGQTIDTFRDVADTTEVDQRITEANEALANATQTKSKADAIRRRAPLPLLEIPEFPDQFQQVLSATLGGAALEAERKVREHLAATSDGLSIEWLSQGHRAQTGTACPHCGQDMEDLDILSVYRALFSGELQAQEDLRDSVTEAADQAFGGTARNAIRETLGAHETERVWWDDAAGFQFHLPTLPNRNQIRDSLIGAHNTLTAVLSRKKANPGTALTLDEEEQQALDTWDAIATEIRTYNIGIGEISQSLEDQRINAETIDLEPLNAQVAALEVSKARHQQPVIGAYVAFDEAVTAKTSAQQTKQTANEALRAQSNQLLAEYGEKINELLELFAVDFRIVSSGVNFRGGQPSGDIAIELLGVRISTTPEDAGNPAQPSLSNTLSGGDRSALALAFFLAKVEQEPALDDSITVFDDPFHSQDRSRQHRTIERIHRLARCAKQCFVLSHDLDFARAVEPIHGAKCRTFLLNPLGTHTTLEPQALPMLPSRAYEVSYALLKDYIDEPGNFAAEMPNVAKTLRTILEEYLQFKFPQRWQENGDWLGTMIGKIRVASGDDPLVVCQGLVADLSQVNEYSQRFHHRTTGATGDIPDERELVTYAKQTLSIIHK